jgi:hypothetical protein
MGRNTSLQSPGGPKGPRRGAVRFHLLHERGDWVLHAQEEHTTNVHSKSVAPHASCSVVHTQCFGPRIDVGLKIRHPFKLIRLPPPTDLPLLVVVLAAQAWDMAHLHVCHGGIEEHVLKLQRGYTRLVEWLLFHPNLTVPSVLFNRINH